jgi:hypothetical protein
MRNKLMMFVMLIAMLLILSPNLKIAADDEPLPCDPPPTHWCEIRGGTFNYVTCRCEFP